MKKIDMVGKKFGRLLVISYSHNNTDNRRCWKCICDCGKETIVCGKRLRTNLTKSCGCLKMEIIKELNKSHGDSCGKKTKEYEIWKSMKQRCLNPKNKEYKNYGLRGIEISESWKNNYLSFLEDMGRQPFVGASIERINNDGNYEKTNCKWIHKSEQRNNRRVTLRITYKGRTELITEWAKITGIRYGSLLNRYHKKWDAEKILTSPVRIYKNK